MILQLPLTRGALSRPQQYLFILMIAFYNKDTYIGIYIYTRAQRGRWASLTRISRLLPAKIGLPYPQKREFVCINLPPVLTPYRPFALVAHTQKRRRESRATQRTERESVHAPYKYKRRCRRRSSSISSPTIIRPRAQSGGERPRAIRHTRARESPRRWREKKLFRGINHGRGTSGRFLTRLCGAHV